MKKVLFMVFAFAVSMFIVPNVFAEANCNPTSETELDTALSSCSVINLQKDKAYNEKDYTISNNVVINGNGATVKGTFSITNGATKVNFNNLTITKNNGANGSQPEFIKVKTKATVNISGVQMYYSDENDSSKFTSAGSGVVVYNTSGNGSTITISNSTIHAKYAVWIEGGSNTVNIKNSDLAGYAALDLTSYDADSGAVTGNKVTIDNSKLTGYAAAKNGSNSYGTIVVGNQQNVSLDIKNNSVIQNAFTGHSTYDSFDVILMAKYSNKETKGVDINVSNSTLINNASTNDLGAIFNNNEAENITFKATNTQIAGNLIAGIDAYYVDFVVDGKSNIVLVDKDGKINPKDIPNTEKNGYDFVGWYYEGTDTWFNTDDVIDGNVTVYAKFTKLENFEDNTNIVVNKVVDKTKLDDVPKTGNIYSALSFMNYLR